MKNLLLVLLALPMFCFGQKCISGNCVNGQGTFIWAKGSKYVGEWKNDRMHGQGTYTQADGTKYVGEFKDDNKSGQGTYYLTDGTKYVGGFRNDMMNGQGTLTSPDGVKYVGEFVDNKYIWPDETSAVHICEWCNIKYNSKGYLVNPQNKVEAVSDFMDTRRTNIYARGYHWFCSKKCASEYLLSLD